MKSFRILLAVVAAFLSSHQGFALVLPTATVKAYTGEPVIGGTDGSVYGKFGVPQPNAVEGTVVLGKKRAAAIFSEATDVVLKVGASPGLTAFPNAIVTRVGQPNGDEALITIKDPQDGVGRANNTLLVSGLTAGVPALLAQAGTPGPANGLPAGVAIRKFLAFDGTGADTFFLARLSGSGVTGANSLALCSATGSTVNIVLRRGEAMMGSTVSRFLTLVGARGTLADSRWRVDDTDFGALVLLANRTQAEVVLSATATGSTGFTAVQTTGTSTIAETGSTGGLAGSSIKALILPGFGATSVAADCLLSRTGSNVTPATDLAIITTDTATSTSTVLARIGTEVTGTGGAPVNGLFYRSLGAPVTGTSGAVSYEARLRGNGVNGHDNAGIWYAANGTTPDLLARTGQLAVTSGTGTATPHYASFLSLALPASSTLTGPIFVARLAVSRTDQITPKNNLGLYAMDSTGTLDLLLQTGQTETVGASTKVVRSFVALAPAPGSIGAENTYDNTGKVTVIATFTDRSQALIKFTVP